MLTEAEIWGIYLGVSGLIAGLSAISLAIFIPFFVERLRRPNLIVTLSANPPIGFTSRILHGRVINLPHGRLTWIDRNPAYDASVRITFLKNDQIFLGPVITKWTRAPECLTPVAQILNHNFDPESFTTAQVFDATKTVFAHNITLPCDNMGQEFDVVIKNINDNECFAIDGWSYRFEGLRNPDFALPLGNFSLEIQVIASNSRSRITRFRLQNTGLNLNDTQLSNF